MKLNNSWNCSYRKLSQNWLFQWNFQVANYYSFTFLVRKLNKIWNCSYWKSLENWLFRGIFMYSFTFLVRKRNKIWICSCRKSSETDFLEEFPVRNNEIWNCSCRKSSEILSFWKNFQRCNYAHSWHFFYKEIWIFLVFGNHTKIFKKYVSIGVIVHFMLRKLQFFSSVSYSPPNSTR